MRSWFSFRALALIQLLLGALGFLHAQDWMSEKSFAPNYGNMKIKQVVHSFDYRESNRKIWHRFRRHGIDAQSRRPR
jgi:hypothetical protein